MIRLIFFLIFFIGANVLNTIHVDSFLFSYFILVMSLLSILLEKNLGQTLKQRKPEIYIILSIVILLVYRYFTGILTDSVRSSMILLITPIILLLLPNQLALKKDLKLSHQILKIILIFYIVECGIAITEYGIRGHIFLWIDTSFESHIYGSQGGSSFRSFALHGSPLTNALIVTTLNSFIIISSLKDKYKLFLWALGFAAVMAFNARAATIVTCFLFIVYLLKLISNKRTSLPTKLSIYFGTVSFAGLVSYLVVFHGLGSRLFKSQLLDQASGQKRLDVFSIFEYQGITEFLTGRSMNRFKLIQENAGLTIIENFWICEIILFGLIFVILFALLYIRLLKIHLKRYTLYNAAIVSISFLLLASTNNSLFTQYIPLLLFSLSAYLFRPGLFELILPPKYITNPPIKHLHK
ncbi:hypothetical protein [Arcticibacterium luteifluviistationis]|uniref:O-antigen ligase domain-containing protein n=1 Tax=Arcticibacterium luteifluviistationis TaxID=1784714 RepID=A0A2Z4GAD4_9BACT|nr:hypothetical protein [Arcticibacterium luteifluviistationis]AWV98045.1 hypothetical protein DJ013_07615 [Arcticibacterium luteifluviistationis]